MCDKLQSSKDGSIDLCHSRFPECNPHGSQHYVSSTSNKYISNRKQKKCQGKNNGSQHRRPDSGRSQPQSHDVGEKRQPFHSRQSGGGECRRWHKQERDGRDRGKHGVNECAKVSNEHSALVNDKRENGKKKMPPTSLNHLLNFTVASSSRDGHGLGSSVVSSSARHRKRNTSHSYNKEEFLQANCQFIVSTSGDYTIHSGDPDKLVEWEHIEQVRLFCHEIPSCPICLYPPKAAKITRCGHVYCWSCLLHYLCLGGKKWSKCPICNESIYRKDIKSVAALSSPQYKVGDTVTMKLMVREKGATRVFPKVDWNNKKDKMLTIEDSCVNQFVKLLSATPAQVLSLIIEPERAALKAQLAGLGKGEDSEECFIQAALEDLKIREAELTQTKAVLTEVEGMIAEYPLLKSSPPPQPPPVVVTTTAGPPPRGLPRLSWKAYADQYFESEHQPAFSDDEEDGSSDSFQLMEEEEEEEEDVKAKAEAGGLSDPLDAVAEDIMSESTASSSNSSSPRSVTSEDSNDGESASPVQSCKENLIYFYQASDGQHLYVHPINTKCLAKEYGGLENCPIEITATLIEIEQFTMSEEVRGRFRSLSHLPLTCELALCELDLRPPTLSHATLKHFSDEIQRRRQRRTKKKKDERRREKRAEAKNSYSESTFHVSSASELTPEKFHDFLSLASSPSLLGSGAAKEKAESGQHPEGNEQRPSPLSSTGPGDICGTPPAPSFAQALQSKSPPVWPTKPMPSKGNQNTPKQQAPSARRSEECYSEESSLVPSFQEAFNEAFVSASESVLAAQKAPGGKPGSKTAKKGRKKLVLFSTGGNRGAC